MIYRLLNYCHTADTAQVCLVSMKIIGRCAVTTVVSAEGQMKDRLLTRGGASTDVIIKGRFLCCGCPLAGRVASSHPMQQQGNLMEGRPLLPKPTMATWATALPWAAHPAGQAHGLVNSRKLLLWKLLW